MLLAHDLLNQCMALEVFITALQAARGGQLAPLQSILIVIDIAVILRIQAPDITDRADPKADDVIVGLGRIALKIALQSALREGAGKRIIGATEMIQTDMAVAQPGQFFAVA